MIDIAALALFALISAGIGALIQGTWQGDKPRPLFIAAVILALAFPAALFAFAFGKVSSGTVLASGFVPFFVLAFWFIRPSGQ